ncbi:MAG: hypothetical protein EBQ94_11530 [Flavobacteriales bacterium]|nr:hypothetical protein [Flavobacteriales bacterium]
MKFKMISMKNLDKLLLISFLISFSCTTLKAQSRKEKNSILLDFALCDCLTKKYAQADSTLVLNDVSLAVYFQEYDFIKSETATAIDSLINAFEVSGKGKGSHTASQVPNSNQIFKECSEFIRAKRLEIINLKR